MKLPYTEMKDILNNVGEIAEGNEINTFHCKSGRGNDKLYIKNTGDSYLFYCFHCGGKGSIQQKLSTYKRHISGNKQVNLSRSWLPDPTTLTTDLSQWPVQALQWPLKGELGLGDISAMKMAYRALDNRVYIPINDSGYISRRVENSEDSPKYLTHVQDSDKFLLERVADVNLDELILVEDVLSCYTLYKYGYNCMAILGTSLSELEFTHIKDKYSKFTVWLDNDNRQVKLNQIKLINKLSVLGTVRVIKTDKDPKEYSKKDIEEVLS